jgi:phosphoglycolate phosphatase
MIRHIIFDLDGTLIDSCGDCVTILSDMLRERGSKHIIDHDAARPWMSKGGEEMVSALMGGESANPQADLMEFRERYRQFKTPKASVFNRVTEGLEKLGMTSASLAICSNKPAVLCERVLEDVDLAAHFDAIVGWKDGMRKKPHPDLLNETLQLLNADPKHCVFIGDSRLDKELAAQANMRFYFVSYGYAEKEWSPGNSISFDSFSQLTDALMTELQAQYV